MEITKKHLEIIRRSLTLYKAALVDDNVDIKYLTNKEDAKHVSPLIDDINVRIDMMSYE